jgi:hypothetical protein
LPKTGWKLEADGDWTRRPGSRHSLRMPSWKRGTTGVGRSNFTKSCTRLEDNNRASISQSCPPARQRGNANDWGRPAILRGCSFQFHASPYQGWRELTPSCRAGDPASRRRGRRLPGVVGCYIWMTADNQPGNLPGDPSPVDVQGSMPSSIGGSNLTALAAGTNERPSPFTLIHRQARPRL